MIKKRLVFIMKKNLILFVAFLLIGVGYAEAANYTLEIIAPREGLNTNSRWYKAYPGIEYKVPIGVFGGAYPFTYAWHTDATCDTATNPATIDADTGIITWSNPLVGDSGCVMAVTVTDDDSNTDTHDWTVTVTTSGFLFIDASAGGGGDGSIGSPFNEMVDVYEGTSYAAMSYDTYDDYFMYFRGGTYGLQGYFDSSGQQYRMQWRTQYKPHVWLEYPGETVIIDHNLAGGSNGAYLDWKDGTPEDTFIHGIKFQDMLNHSFRIKEDRITWFECEFYNLGPGMDEQNSSFIMFIDRSGGSNAYVLIKDTTFDDLNTGAFLKFYSMLKLVVDNNTFTNGSGSPLEGIAIKAYDSYVDIRGNTIDGIARHAISGNWNTDHDIEIRFNKVLNANDNYSSDIYGALTVNYHDTAGVAYIHRNTFEGTVSVRRATSDDGPFYFSNNVIVNENSGTPSGSHISHIDVDDTSRIIIREDPDDNLVGSASDGIIDANGDLTEAYSEYVGTKGCQTTPSSTPSNTITGVTIGGGS